MQKNGNCSRWMAWFFFRVSFTSHSNVMPMESTLTKLQVSLVICHRVNQSDRSTGVPDSLLDKVDVGGDYVTLALQPLLLLLLKRLILDQSRREKKRKIISASGGMLNNYQRHVKSKCANWKSVLCVFKVGTFYTPSLLQGRAAALRTQVSVPSSEALDPTRRHPQTAR